MSNELEKQLNIDFKKEDNEKDNTKMINIILKKLFSFYKGSAENDNEKFYKNELSSKIDKMIEANLFTLVQESINNGYRLNKKQLQNFNEKLIQEIVDTVHERNAKIGNIFELGYDVNNNLLVKIISTTAHEKAPYVNKELFEKANLSKELGENKIISYLREALDTPEFVNKLCEKNLQDLKLIEKNKGDITEADEILDLLLIYIDRLSMDQCLDIADISEKVKNIVPEGLFFSTEKARHEEKVKYLNKSILIFKKHLDEGFKIDKKEFIENIKDISLEAEVNKQIVSSIKKSSNFDLNDLPQKAKDLLLNIEKNLNKCIKNKDLLYHEDMMTVELIHEKRLSETLVKYLKIDKEYRLILKDSNNKNAEDLMINSLEEFNNMLQKFVTSLNISSLKDLSVNNKYVKALNNN